MKYFHSIDEGAPALKGVNYCRRPGWLKFVFFCGDCKLYFRTRWKIGAKWAPRVFLSWSLRKEQAASYYEVVDGNIVPCAPDEWEFTESYMTYDGFK